MSNIYKSMRSSFFWRSSTFLMQFFSLAIYSRLFTPLEFGVVASLFVLVLFLQLLTEAGISVSIVNLDEINDTNRNGIFSFTLITGLVSALVIFSFKDNIANYYNQNSINDIANYFSVSIFFYSLSIVPYSSLLKECDFIRIGKAEIVSEIVSLSCIVFLYNRSDIEHLQLLALKYALNSFFRFILMWWGSRSTKIGLAKFGSDISFINELAKFGIYQLFSTTLNYFSRNLDSILVGRNFGSQTIGIYDKAYQLMKYPIIVLTFTIMPSIQPIIKKEKLNNCEIDILHKKFIKFSFSLSLLASAFIYVNAESIVYIIFGDQWGDTIPIVKILSFAIPAQAILSSSGSFFLALSKPKLMFVSSFLSSLVNISGIIFGVYSGDIETLSWVIVGCFNFNILQTYFLMYKFGFNTSCITLYKLIIYVFMRTIAVVFVYYVLSGYVVYVDSQIISLLCNSSIAFSLLFIARKIKIILN